ncbi:MAG: hypothetical protein WB565_18060 [Acidimicrobiales bacterium]
MAHRPSTAAFDPSKYSAATWSTLTPDERAVRARELVTRVEETLAWAEEFRKTMDLAKALTKRWGDLRTECSRYVRRRAAVELRELGVALDRLWDVADSRTDADPECRDAAHFAYCQAIARVVSALRAETATEAHQSLIARVCQAIERLWDIRIRDLDRRPNEPGPASPGHLVVVNPAGPHGPPTRTVAPCSAGAVEITAA